MGCTRFSVYSGTQERQRAVRFKEVPQRGNLLQEIIWLRTAALIGAIYCLVQKVKETTLGQTARTQLLFSNKIFLYLETTYTNRKFGINQSGILLLQPF